MVSETCSSSESWKFSTSVLVILPFGPEPWILDNGIPKSSASFLAMGDAIIDEGVISGSVATLFSEISGILFEISTFSVTGVSESSVT